MNRWSSDDDRIQSVETYLNYKFVKNDLALQAISPGFTCLDSYDSAEKLALFGIMALKLALASRSYDRGDDTERINRIISTKTSDAYLMGKGFDKDLDLLMYGVSQNGRVSDEKMATTVKALFGAVYIDSCKSIQAVTLAMDTFFGYTHSPEAGHIIDYSMRYSTDTMRNGRDTYDISWMENRLSPL
ncbi:hypothetical protein ASPWEDRAFT_44612 [Aspergillus wentii DTO 134E9]|uniref:RNase III domain-containing protein n=1 Tax=Aspergillus wentii DTO 134E9 TaxID=1073089 RepID=A0A1L9RC31_ASPWE|nr:uncharacterized protein ASPWEDRAFT_44612 [Aspergillus wentii DTO 134E9]KAI9935032.1 hypothetical protein MW887_000653 [Aspergillus wentii]OJJ32474.1 hypothetical protein ASPWEDRAFT_44612 [Aspergillus wentii DTO 134E9]